MPTVVPSLTAQDVADFVRTQCFSPLTGRVGAEIEFLTFPATGAGPVDFSAVRAAAEGVPMPAGGRLTFEPGGQVEVSTPPAATIGHACDAAAADIGAVQGALASLGVRLVGLGLDPVRPGARVVDAERYRAMEAYFDAQGPNGRTMMCRTAAVQVNLDAGTDRTAADRWHLAHAIGPMLAAAFANSPFLDGEPTGWRSTRMANWWSMDPTRTAPAVADRDPFDAWTDYLLRARVMLIRAGEDRFVPVTEPLSFGRWLDEGHELGYPTPDDLRYHVTTVFPPVRARGWLELRVIDALPEPWWRVAVGVPAALMDDEEASEIAARATRPVAALWHDAFRSGLSHPALAAAAASCFGAALDALPRVGADRETIAATAAFIDRYVARRRCPADDLIEASGVIDLREPEPAWI